MSRTFSVQLTEDKHTNLLCNKENRLERDRMRLIACQIIEDLGFTLGDDTKIIMTQHEEIIAKTITHQIINKTLGVPADATVRVKTLGNSIYFTFLY